jgi:hypothetical protein
MQLCYPKGFQFDLIRFLSLETCGTLCRTIHIRYSQNDFNYSKGRDCNRCCCRSFDCDNYNWDASNADLHISPAWAKVLQPISRQKNWVVAVADLQRGPGEALTRTLGANANFFETDVASYESQAKTFEAGFKKWGRIDALLANAGIVDKSSNLYSKLSKY